MKVVNDSTSLAPQKCLRALGIFFLWLACGLTQAQNLTIVSITENTHDVVGRADTRLDLNNQPCALLKFTMPAPITRVEGNYMGKPVTKNGEQWVYVTNGTNRIDITAEGYLPLSISFPKHGIRRIKGGIVYRIKLAEEEEGADMNAEEAYALALASLRANDNNNAFKWTQRAVDKGSIPALTLLGDLYEAGRGVQKSTEKALSYYQRAANQGEPVGQMVLASCYMEGTLTAPDTLKAFQWFQRAADQNFPDAIHALSEFYEEGFCVEKDVEKAVQLVRQAAQMNSKYGMLTLARYYELGIGIERDHQEALSWLRKASAAGNNAAKQLLDKMTEEEFKSKYETKKTFQELWDELEKELKEKAKANEDK